MSPQRRHCLDTMNNNIGVPIELVTWKDLDKYILPEHPLHPAFRYLSCVHKADYLRCYFMHFYGGGYADIKPYTDKGNWRLCFDIINEHPEIQIIGQPEVFDGTPVPEYRNPHGIERLISVCYYICRSKSVITTAWYAGMIEKLNKYLPELKKHPASDPFGGPGYPIPWASILADVLHRVIMESRETAPNAVCSALASGRNREEGWR